MPSTRWMVRSMWDEIFALPGRVIAFFFALALLLFPLWSEDPYILRILILAAIFSMFAVSWDFLAGYAGQVSLGHALFFGAAAYATASLNLRLGLAPYLTIPLGALAAMLVGLVAGVPCLRLRGPYLALATLAFPLLLTGLVFSFPKFTGGELGLFRIQRLASTRFLEYYIVVGTAVATVFFLWWITRSRVGLILQAIREDEVAARSLGINTTFYKLLAFSLSGFVAGIAGGLHAHFLRTAGPGNLDMFMSFQPVIWTMFGGMATIYGPVTGVFALFPAMEYLRGISEYRTLVFALLVLLILRFLPGGLAQWARERMEKDCPRCRAKNAFFRRSCRACEAALAAPRERA